MLTPPLPFVSARSRSVSVCAVCKDGYTSGLGYTCSKCNDERHSLAITMGAILVAAAIAVVARSLMVLGTDTDVTAAVEGFSTADVGEGRSRLVRAKASEALKTIVVSWQIVTQASRVLVCNPWR